MAWTRVGMTPRNGVTRGVEAVTAGRALVLVLLVTNAAIGLTAAASGTGKRSVSAPVESYGTCGASTIGSLSGRVLDLAFRPVPSPQGSTSLWLLTQGSDAEASTQLHRVSIFGFIEANVTSMVATPGMTAASFTNGTELSVLQSGATLNKLTLHDALSSTLRRSFMPLCRGSSGARQTCLEANSAEALTSFTPAAGRSGAAYFGVLRTAGGGQMLVTVSEQGVVGSLFSGITPLTAQALELTDIHYSAATDTLFVLCEPCGAIFQADLHGKVLSVDSLSLLSLPDSMTPRALAVSPGTEQLVVAAEGAGDDASTSLLILCRGAPTVSKLSTRSDGPMVWPAELMDAERSCCYFGTFCHRDNCAILQEQGWEVELVGGPTQPSANFAVWSTTLMDDARTCCVLEEVCSPFNCDYLLSKGWEVPLSVPRVEPQPVPPFDLQSCAPMRLAPPAGVSGLPTGLAIDPSARTYWILYHDAGRRRHWVVEMRYSGTMLRALELSGLVSPTGLTWMGSDRLAVVDGASLSVNEFDVSTPGQVTAGGVSPTRSVFYQSAAYSAPEEPLSGLAYDATYDWFYAVKSSAPRSVFLLRWDGSGDHLFEMNEPYWMLRSARLAGLDFDASTRSLFILADEVTRDGITATTVWETKLNATMVGFLTFERLAPIPAQGLAVTGRGSTFVLVAGSDLISYTSGLCLDSYGELALQQEQISRISEKDISTGPWLPSVSGNVEQPRSSGSGGPRNDEDSSGREFRFPVGLPGALDSPPAGVFSFRPSAKAPAPATYDTRLRTVEVANAVQTLDPFLAKSLMVVHNAVRAWHGAANLTWDNELTSVAEDTAQQCGSASVPGGTNVASGQGLDYVIVGLDWYTEGRFYSAPGTAEAFSQMVWQATERIGCAMAACRRGETAIACAYDPPGNTWGRYDENVQSFPGITGSSGQSVSNEALPPWLAEQVKQQKEREESQRVVMGTEFVPAPGGPSSFIAASRRRSGELGDPINAPNFLLTAPTPALNFLATPYELPEFELPAGYNPSGVDLGCLIQSRGRCPKGFFECRGLCYTVAQRATMPPSLYTGEGQGVEMRCGVCAKSRVAFVGQDPAMTSVVARVAETAGRPIMVRKRRFRTTPNPLAAEQYQPWYTFTAYSGLADQDAPTYDRIGRDGAYDGVVQPGALLCVNTLERLRAADNVGDAAHFSWEGGCEGFETNWHRFWPQDNWPLPGW